MPSLIHLIYCSAAKTPLQDADLRQLLVRARAKNARLGITGMLLYENGSFFQILEGVPETVDQLFQQISQDERHTKVTTIIHEPIVKRAFAEWTMGYSNVSPEELDEIVGMNDFFTDGSSFTQINPGRAKKLLSAFRDGRWRSKVKYAIAPDPGHGNEAMLMRPATMLNPKVSFAFQPIIDARSTSVIAYEAIIRGQNNEAFSDILPLIEDQEWSYFDTSCRAIAISLAAKLGLSCSLNINFMASRLEDAHTAIGSSLDAAEKNGIEPSRIILQIDQARLIDEPEQFARIIEEYRGAGLRISINQFGSGRAGLNLLEPLRPEMISLNAKLVRGIDKNGPRQAIVLGLLQTCNDLGIDLVAKHIEKMEEYEWFCQEGINLMQGDLIVSPGFELLPCPIYPRL